MVDTGWEMGPLDYMELEEAGESWGLGQISDPFPDCSGGSRQARAVGEGKGCAATQ